MNSMAPTGQLSDQMAEQTHEQARLACLPFMFNVSAALNAVSDISASAKNIANKAVAGDLQGAITETASISTQLAHKAAEASDKLLQAADSALNEDGLEMSEEEFQAQLVCHGLKSQYKFTQRFCSQANVLDL